MSDVFAFTIKGDRDFTVKLDKFPKAAHDRLFVEIDQLIDQLYARILGGAPRGKTGKLARSIKKSVSDRQNRIVGSVFVDADWAKAGAEEYGAHRPTKVRSHEMKLGHLWSRVLSPPITVDVGSFTRTPNIAERDFMRGPARAMQSQVEIVLGRALDEVAQQP